MTVNIQNLCKSFSSGLVLDHLNLHLDSSKCYCLMGPSGRGKTTLLRILMGLETADSARFRMEQSRIGVVFQEDRLCRGLFPSTMYVWLQISRDQAGTS
ncbi:MAG: ATP-binding cassette domain-containing protein [Hungatella sp.]